MISNPHQSLPTPTPSTHLIQEEVEASTYAGLQEPRWMLAAGRILFCGSCTYSPARNSLISLCGKVVEYPGIGFYGHRTCGRRDETSCTVPELYLNLYSNTPTKHLRMDIIANVLCANIFADVRLAGTEQVQHSCRRRRRWRGKRMLLAAHGMKNICTPHWELFFCEILTVVAMFVTTTTHAENKERNKLSISCFHSRKSAGMYEGGKWVPVRKTMK